MKIGEFASENQQTIDTIRHYMAMGLIVPLKKNNLYNFDDTCQKDMALINELKSYGFKLREMRLYFFYKRMFSVDSPYAHNFLLHLLSEKNKEHIKEIEVLNSNLLAIEAKKTELIQLKNTSDVTYQSNIGVPLSALAVMKCPKCNQPLTLNTSQVINNQIIDGSLRCQCNNHYIIDQGLLYDKYNYEQRQESDSESVKHYIHDYILESSPEYLETHYKIMEWGKSYLNLSPKKDRIILECGSYLGYILRSLLEDLSDNSLYICLGPKDDSFYGIKEILESFNTTTNVLFLITEWDNAPIQKGCVDAIIDGNATLNYFLNNAEEPDSLNVLSYCYPYLKNKGRYIGYYLQYKHFGTKQDFIASSVRHRFNSNYFSALFEPFDMEDITDKEFDAFTEECAHELYYKDGDHVNPILIVKDKK